MEYSKKLQIFVCTHKPSPYTRNGGIYRAIQCGAALNPEIDSEYLRDDVGENISERNPYWSEWSGIYWIWKNVKDVEYIGINHYRRYFDLDITEDNIETLLDGKDMIVVKGEKMKHKYDRFPNLCHVTSLKEANIFMDVLLGEYPELEEKLNVHFYNSRESYPNSIFIMPYGMFDCFCHFVFPLLFEIERRISAEGIGFSPRNIGYFGEWMLEIYVNVINKNALLAKVCQSDKSRISNSFLKSVYKQTLYFYSDIIDLFYSKPGKLQ